MTFQHSSSGLLPRRLQGFTPSLSSTTQTVVNTTTQVNLTVHKSILFYVYLSAYDHKQGHSRVAGQTFAWSRTQRQVFVALAPARHRFPPFMSLPRSKQMKKFMWLLKELLTTHFLSPQAADLWFPNIREGCWVISELEPATAMSPDVWSSRAEWWPTAPLQQCSEQLISYQQGLTRPLCFLAFIPPSHPLPWSHNDFRFCSLHRKMQSWWKVQSSRAGMANPGGQQDYSIRASFIVAVLTSSACSKITTGLLKSNCRKLHLVQRGIMCPRGTQTEKTDKRKNAVS